MSYRPITESERKHYEDEIKKLQDDINIKQQTINDYKEKIEKGNWVSDIDWSKNVKK